MALTTRQIDEFWRIADTNQDGKLTIQELARAVKKYDKSVSDATVAGMFCAIDKDQSKTITKQEFYNDMSEREKRTSAMEKLFRKYDKDNNNTLSRGELIQLIKECFKENQVNSIVGEFLNYSDKNGDGVITYNEFKEFFG